MDPPNATDLLLDGISAPFLDSLSESPIFLPSVEVSQRVYCQRGHQQLPNCLRSVPDAPGVLYHISGSWLGRYDHDTRQSTRLAPPVGQACPAMLCFAISHCNRFVAFARADDHLHVYDIVNDLMVSTPRTPYRFGINFMSFYPVPNSNIQFLFLAGQSRQLHVLRFETPFDSSLPPVIFSHYLSRDLELISSPNCITLSNFSNCHFQFAVTISDNGFYSVFSFQTEIQPSSGLMGINMELVERDCHLSCTGSRGATGDYCEFSCDSSFLVCCSASGMSVLDVSFDTPFRELILITERGQNLAMILPGVKHLEYERMNNLSKFHPTNPSRLLFLTSATGFPMKHAIVLDVTTATELARIVAPSRWTCIEWDRTENGNGLFLAHIGVRGNRAVFRVEVRDGIEEVRIRLEESRRNGDFVDVEIETVD